MHHNDIHNTHLVVNLELNRFEIEVEDVIAFIDFQKKENTYYLIHTEVPVTLKGKGIGTTLVTRTLEWVKNNNAVIVALCPFVVSYLEKNPVWKSVLK